MENKAIKLSHSTAVWQNSRPLHLEAKLAGGLSGVDVQCFAAYNHITRLIKLYARDSGMVHSSGRTGISVTMSLNNLDLQDFVALHGHTPKHANRSKYRDL